MRFHRLLLPIAAGILAAARLAGAAETSPAEAKLREQLRNTMTQLRTAENEKSALQAAQAQIQADKDADDKKIEDITKQMATDANNAKAKIDDLNTKEEAKAKQIAELEAKLAEWQKTVGERNAMVEKLGAEKQKLQGEVIELQRHVADQRAKNQEMYATGKEILDRYQKFGLGTALTAREPFVGTTRVKLETLVQDYNDKLTDSSIKPEPVSGGAAPASAPAGKKPVKKE